MGMLASSGNTYRVMELPQLLMDIVYFTGFFIHSAVLLLSLPIIHATVGPPVHGWSFQQHLAIRLVRAVNSSLNLHQQRILQQLRGWLNIRGRQVMRDDALSGYWLEETPWSIRERLARREMDVLILYIHGGGFCNGTPLQSGSSVHDWCRQLAQQGVRAAALLLEYQLAPEAVYPQPVDHIVRSIRALQQVPGIEGVRVVLAGDSAGGHLAIAAAQRLTKAEQPDALILVSPWVRFYPASDAVSRNLSTDILTPNSLRLWADTYLGVKRARSASSAKSGEAGPLLTATTTSTTTTSAPNALSTADVPRCLIMVGGRELFVEDVVAYACMLEEAGTPVDIQVEPDAVHVYAIEPALAGRVVYSRALSAIATYMRNIAFTSRPATATTVDVVSPPQTLSHHECATH